jgi:hypothetical protein
VAALPNQVDDCPVLFALLQVIDCQFGDLMPSEATRQKNCQQCSVTLTSEPLRIWCLPKGVSLLGC